MKKIIQKRQGDLLIESVHNIPEGAEFVEGRVLAEGEATGHMHKLSEGQLFRSKNGDLYFRTELLTVLEHDEHRALEFPPGTYRVIQQRQFTGRESFPIGD